MNSEKIIDLESRVDFTLLDPRATEFDLEKMCEIAYKHSYYAVCVNPCNVAFVKGYIQNNLNDSLKIVSVAGFPLGSNTTDSKVFEVREILKNGADEVDLVVNIGKVKQGKFDYVKNEIKQIRKIVKKKILKVIIETCYLTKNEIVKLSKLCAYLKVDYIKTSTGFGTGGALEEDVILIKNAIKNSCKIKASGGIRTRESAIVLINLGVDRIGTSHIL